MLENLTLKEDKARAKKEAEEEQAKKDAEYEANLPQMIDDNQIIYL